MHGIIFSNLFKFIRENHGYDTLKEIKKDAGVNTTFYDTTKSHPDSELQNLVASACKVLNVDGETLLETFGSYIAPGLLQTYKSFMKPEWDCMDLLEHVELTMHRAVRASTKDTSPPILKIKRLSKSQIQLDYSSERKMISLGVGIIKAIGQHYNEDLIIERNETATGTTLLINRK